MSSIARGFVGSRLEHPGSLELREVRVDGRGRPQADGLADLTDGGRIAVLVDVLVQVLEDRALPLGHWLPPVANMCSITVARAPDGVKKKSGTVLTSP